MTNPVRKSDILIQEIGNEAFLYDPQQGHIHVLNTTAICVWNLCDGTHTVQEIVDQLCETYQFSSETDVYNDVIEILQTFTRLGTLT